MANNGTKFAKEAVNGYQFISGGKYTTVMSGFHKALLGHNRYATQGAKTDENAHPFDFPNVIGMHNGTLKSWYSMHDSHKYTVDSQALYSNLNEHGIEETWKKLNGAAALTWINKGENTINFIRNKERELFWSTMNQGKTLVWASEAWMLQVATWREGHELDMKPVMFNENEHVKVALRPDGFEMERTTLEAYVAPKLSYSYSNSSYTGGSSTYAEGKKHLENEGVKVNEKVEFVVDKISDFYSYGRHKVNVYGTTMKGTPVRIWSMDGAFFEELIDAMHTEQVMFSGTVANALSQGISIVHSSVQREADKPIPEAEEVRCYTCWGKFPKEGTEIVGGRTTCRDCKEDLQAIEHLDKYYH